MKEFSIQVNWIEGILRQMNTEILAGLDMLGI